jgi:hypothetical protein
MPVLHIAVKCVQRRVRCFAIDLQAIRCNAQGLTTKRRHFFDCDAQFEIGFAIQRTRFNVTTIRVVSTTQQDHVSWEEVIALHPNDIANLNVLWFVEEGRSKERISTT